MNRSLSRIVSLTGLVVWMASSSWAQAPSPSPAPAPQPAQPGAGAGGNRGNTGQQEPSQQQGRDTQLPLFVEGQIVDENGKSPSDPVSVKLTCGVRTLQTVRADIKGYFRFALGMGTQANTDFSAADEAPPQSMLTGMNVQGGYGGFGTASAGLTGCDVRISMPGYVPLDVPITDPASLGMIDVGVLELRRVGSVAAGSVSATALLVPNNARKEYEQGLKDLRSNRLPQATQHLMRAVGAYDKYAAAWNELGRAYAAGRDMPKAREAYEKAIVADPKFAPPYVSLGALQLEAQDYEGALDSISKAVAIDPTITEGLAGYIQGVANFRLNRMDAAQESLLQAENGPHPSTPQLHVLLVELYLRKQDSAAAAAHMRAYIKEAPQGSFAVQMRQRLTEIGQAAANQPGGPGPRPVAP